MEDSENIYVNGDMDRELESVKEWMEETEEGIRIIIGGDFNVRMGEEGRGVDKRSCEEGEGGRKSKDKKINGEGKMLLRKLEKVEWTIFNGNVEGDKNGDWMYTERRREVRVNQSLIT